MKTGCPRKVIWLVLALMMSSRTSFSQSATSAQSFGLHGHHFSDATPWPSVPFGSWRLWDTHTTWNDIEPQKGKWNFALLDKDVALAEQHHVSVLYTFGHIPDWAALRPQTDKQASELKSMDDWREFVETVAKRYKGRIHAYELWNEPNHPNYYGGNISHLVEMMSVAYKAIKSVDPAAIVASPSASRDSEWLDRYLKAGGDRDADVIAFHMYVHPKGPEAIGETARAVRQVMRQNGQGGKPLWDTETGWASPRPLPKDLAAAYVARSYLVALTSGISRFYWYSWDNHNWVSLETTESDSKTMTPAGKAYGEVERWLVGATLDSCKPDASGTWTCSLTRDGHQQLAVWSTSGKRNFSVGGGFTYGQVHHLDGSVSKLSNNSLQISQEPVLITK